MKIHFRFYDHDFHGGLAFLLSLILAVSPVQAQIGSQPQIIPTRIQIALLEGEGAIDKVGQRVSSDPVVRVDDEGGRPVMGAAVVFSLPISGTSGEFTDGSKNLTVMTDKQGLATASRLKTNLVAGKLQIHINASYRGLSSRAIMTRFNMAVPGMKTGGRNTGKIVAILAIVGGAAAGGAIAATRKSNTPASNTPTPAPPTPIGITPGGTIIGPPQ